MSARMKMSACSACASGIPFVRDFFLGLPINGTSFVLMCFVSGIQRHSFLQMFLMATLIRIRSCFSLNATRAINFFRWVLYRNGFRESKKTQSLQSYRPRVFQIYGLHPVRGVMFGKPLQHCVWVVATQRFFMFTPKIGEDSQF